MLRKIAGNCCYQLGRSCLNLGPLAVGHAGRCFRMARRLWPSHPQVGPWLDYLDGARAMTRGRADEAVVLLARASHGLPDVAAIRARLGITQTMLGRDEEAVTILERVLAEDVAGLLPDVWTSLAWSYLRQGRSAQSLEACRRAEHSGLQSSRLQLIQRLATGAQIGALAVHEVRELLRSVPQGMPLVLEYARLQAQQRRHRLARTAISALPEEIQARSLAVIGQASLNQDDAATTLWAAEQLSHAGDAEALTHGALLKGEAHLRQGDPESALAALRQALDQVPNDGRLREQAGRVLLISGQWEAAVEEMVEALHAGVGSALAAGLAALAALELGDAQSARGLFVVQRSGDVLACAFAHTAQARLMALDGDLAGASAAAAQAIADLSGLPPWANVDPVRSRLEPALRAALQAVRDVGNDEQRAEATGMLARLGPGKQPAPGADAD